MKKWVFIYTLGLRTDQLVTHPNECMTCPRLQVHCPPLPPSQRLSESTTTALKRRPYHTPTNTIHQQWPLTLHHPTSQTQVLKRSKLVFFLRVFFLSFSFAYQCYHHIPWHTTTNNHFGGNEEGDEHWQHSRKRIGRSRWQRGNGPNSESFFPFMNTN
jgi:hypothetical protein